MSSKQLRKQARLNGAKAAGSKTPAGIEKSSANSLKHGLTGKTIVLASESQKDLDDLHLTYVQEFQPESGVEMDLIDQMVAAQWRLRRMWRMQTTALDVKVDQQQEWLAKTYDQITAAERDTIAFTSLANDGKSLELLLRYETASSRAHQRAMNSLFKLRKEKLRNDPEPPSEPRPSEPANENYETTPIAAPVPEAQLKLITLPGCTAGERKTGVGIDGGPASRTPRERFGESASAVLFTSSPSGVVLVK